jgi:hypothetical protein
MSLNYNNKLKKTEKEIEQEKRELESKIQELFEQQQILACSDRQCNKEGCSRLGVYLVVACKVSYGRFGSCNNPLYDKEALRYTYDYHSYRHSDYHFEVKAHNFHPFYFLCKDHMEEQMLANNKHNSALIRENLMAGSD